MPDGLEAQISMLKTIKDSHPGLVCFLEKTGTFFPGDSPVSACVFARHCGNVESALLALNIRTAQVHPRKWQSCLNIPSGLPKPDRKHLIQSIMQSKFPDIRVTLTLADGLALLDYGMNHLTEYFSPMTSISRSIPRRPSYPPPPQHPVKSFPTH